MSYLVQTSRLPLDQAIKNSPLFSLCKDKLISVGNVCALRETNFNIDQRNIYIQRNILFNTIYAYLILIFKVTSKVSQ